MLAQRITRIATLAAVALTLRLAAQDPKPTCNQCPATYVEQSEIQAYAKRAMDNHLTDQQIRSVDIGKSQLGIGVVYRGKLDQTPKNAVAEHDFISEVYHVIEGTRDACHRSRSDGCEAAPQHHANGSRVQWPRQKRRRHP